MQQHISLYHSPFWHNIVIPLPIKFLPTDVTSIYINRSRTVKASCCRLATRPKMRTWFAKCYTGPWIWTYSLEGPRSGKLKERGQS